MARAWLSFRLIGRLQFISYEYYFLIPSFSADRLSIFEIYPQSEMPLLNQIAHLDWVSSEEDPAHLLPDILICRIFQTDKIVFRVVNYRTNHSTSFSANVDVTRVGSTGKHDVEVFKKNCSDVEVWLLIIYWVDIRNEDSYHRLL